MEQPRRPCPDARNCTDRPRDVDHVLGESRSSRPAGGAPPAAAAAVPRRADDRGTLPDSRRLTRRGGDSLSLTRT
eukprot:6378919-Prymnesium_polylepis.1